MVDKHSEGSLEGIVGSSALEQPEYWWFRVRSMLLSTIFSPYMKTNSRILDVGSSNSPSSQWMKQYGKYIPMDVDPRGLPEDGIVGSVLDIPFEEKDFDIVSAFDVIEHIGDDQKAVQEIFRVLKPGGYFILSVPAYEWAWSENDVHNAHFRRYTKRRMKRLLEREGFRVARASYGFSSTFPIFAGNILLTKFKERNNPPRPLPEGGVHELTEVSAWQEKILLKLSERDQQALARGKNLKFGSSLFVCAVKPEA